VDRRTVFSIARKADTIEGRRHLLVAALVWGTGTKAQSVRRRAQIFLHSPDADIDARLKALRERGDTEAYWALNNVRHIRHLGAAFFTKVTRPSNLCSELGNHEPRSALGSVSWIQEVRS
jgi:hypothetical protein